MQKEGGIIALIAGVLSLLLLIAEAFLIMASPVFADSDKPVLVAYVIGLAILVAIIIALSITSLKTTRRWPRIALVIGSLYTIMAFGIDFWIVSACLFFALIGGLMSLNLNYSWWALILVLSAVFFVVIVPSTPSMPYTPIIPFIVRQIWQESFRWGDVSPISPLQSPLPK